MPLSEIMNSESRNLIQLSGQSAQFSNWLPKSDWWIWLNFWIFIQLCIESIWLMIGSSVIGPTICCCDVCIFSNFIILGAVAGMSRMLEWLSNCSYQFLKRMNVTHTKKRWGVGGVGTEIHTTPLLKRDVHSLNSRWTFRDLEKSSPFTQMSKRVINFVEDY